MDRSFVRRAQTGEPGNPGQFGHQRHTESDATLHDTVTLRIRKHRWTTRTYLDAVNDDGIILGRLEHRLISPPGYLKIGVLEVDSRYRKMGLARRLMAELERMHPGVPIRHGALSNDGLAFNTAVYGRDTRDNALTRIYPGDDDADEYDEYAWVLYGKALYRGGWTLDGVRIPKPRC